MTELPPAPAHDAHCYLAHVRVTIDSVNDEAVHGSHLRQQRLLVGFSTRALADAVGLSPTRIRQLEDADHVSARATVRYLDGIAAAWRRRAEECSPR